MADKRNAEEILGSPPKRTTRASAAEKPMQGDLQKEVSALLNTGKSRRQSRLRF